MIQVGLQAGFGHPMAPDLPGIAAHGFSVVRQDLYAVSASSVQSLVAELAGAPCVPLFLVGGGHLEHPGSDVALEPYQLAAMVTEVVTTARAVGLADYLLEIGNEPDLAVPRYADHPEDFAEAVRACHFAARAAGFQGPVLSGGISNLNTRGLTYLQRMVSSGNLPADDLVIGFHRYPESNRGPLAPHFPPYRSREEEWQAVLSIVGSRPLACTEFGYHTADVLSDIGVAASVLWDLSFYEARGVRVAVVYQLNDGPGHTWMDRYGVRRLDGSWKPVADAVQAVYGHG